jgi:hypothetical protein
MENKRRKRKLSLIKISMVKKKNNNLGINEILSKREV